MAIFVIGDLHLSFSSGKPMDVFKGWENYTQRIKTNWQRLINPEDTVILAGDISWALDIKDAVSDFKFINELNGKKIISKGNHDYWWQTNKKLCEFLQDNNFDTISFLHNNSYEVEDKIICGTRGWIFDDTEEHNEKIILREAQRLKTSLEYIKSDKEKIAILHYPPIYQDLKSTQILNTLKEYNVKRCYYAHLHGKTIDFAFNSHYEGIKFKLISADSVYFTPVLID